MVTLHRCLEGLTADSNRNLLSGFQIRRGAGERLYKPRLTVVQGSACKCGSDADCRLYQRNIDRLGNGGHVARHVGHFHINTLQTVGHAAPVGLIHGQRPAGSP